MHDIDISQVNGRILRIFLAVYDQRSVSKAAHLLEINQSTVSHSIEKLRGILGDGLFVQAGRGIIPSAHAELMAPKVRRLLADMAALVDLGEYEPHEDPEPFSIASNGSTLACGVSRIRDAIWKHVPDKTVTFRELGTASNAEVLLDSGRANIAITVRPSKYPQALKHQPFSSDQMVVFYDPSAMEPVRTITDFCNARHATLDFGGSAKSELEKTLEKQGLTRKIACMAPNAWLLAEMIRGTDMIATLPSQVAQSAFFGLRHCPLPVTQSALNFDLVWHRRYDNSARLKWLRDIVQIAMTPEGQTATGPK